MEKVYCQHCDEQLEVREFMEPSYDDGGSVDGFDLVEHVYDCMCKGACKERDEILKMFYGELPF